MPKEIIVVTAAYGKDPVLAAGGQQALLPVIAKSGASGVEIRRELFTTPVEEALPALATDIASMGLDAYYSVPQALYTADGELNPHLEQYLTEAEQLNARMIKFALGHYIPGVSGNELRNKLVGKKVKLVVENDQTEYGRLTVFDTFFQTDEDSQFCHGMTFDMGNWLWVGEQPLPAAERLSAHVSYIHVKAALPHGDSWCAVPPDAADNLWRETLARLPPNVPRAIEFPLEGPDLVAVTRRYVDLLREA